VTNPKNEKLHDLTPREILTFAPLMIMVLWIGLYPKPFFQILEQPVNQLVQTIHDKANANTPVNARNMPVEMTPVTTRSRVTTAPSGPASATTQPKASH
jgi:hypothetical protein